MRGLNGRRVILTGGASGIGRAAALRLAAEGCVLGIFDLDETGAQRDRGAVPAAGEGAIASISPIAIRLLALASFEAACGPVQGLANIAGWDTPTRSSIPTARYGTR